jgi:hypothetical protein
MYQALEFVDKVPWTIAIALAATLGLAPFYPEPHLWEKLKMLLQGTLSKPIDIFDMLMHGAPWLLLLAKGLRIGLR